MDCVGDPLLSRDVGKNQDVLVFQGLFGETRIMQRRLDIFAFQGQCLFFIRTDNMQWESKGEMLTLHPTTKNDTLCHRRLIQLTNFRLIPILFQSSSYTNLIPIIVLFD